MSPAARITEIDLHAYLDGELDPQAVAEVESWLNDHPEDAARLEDYRQHRHLLSAGFDTVLQEPIPAHLEELAARVSNQSTQKPWRRIAAALLFLALGSLIGWTAKAYWPDGPSVAQNTVDTAAGAHVVYVKEVRHPVEVGADETAHLVKWLSKRLGAPLKAADLTDKGFILMGGRLLPDQGHPAAQFMYEHKTGKRLTIYQRRRGKEAETAFNFMATNSLSAFYWVEGSFSYAIVAELPRNELLAVARVIYDQLEE